MHHRAHFTGLSRLLAATVLAAACGDAISPDRHGPGGPEFSHAGPGVELDRFNGTTGTAPPPGVTELIKGFDPVNPHRGSTIIATFIWRGSTTNIITRVFDHLSSGPANVVGNTYTLVEYVNAAGLSMATYVATNVQNFPDPNDPSRPEVLVVRAELSQPIMEGGVSLSAWTGVAPTLAAAVRGHRSASGSDTSTTQAAAGPVAVAAGGLVYAVTTTDRLVGHERPAGFTEIAVRSSPALKHVEAYDVPPAADSTNPQWTWFFTPTAPGTWLATVLTLNPVDSTPPPPPATGNLTVTTATTGSDVDPDGYTVTVDGMSQPIATSGSVTFTGLAEGSHSVALSGTAPNCSVSGANPHSVSVPAGGTASTTFSVTCTATSGDTIRIAGVGSLGTGGAIPGADRQDFDLDVASTLSGRVLFRDWTVIRGDGTTGTLRVDGDAATGITAFRNSSTTCSDPARGVEFDGVGRLNSGGDTNPTGDEWFPFTVVACDNGPAGSGVDFFRLDIPSRPYSRSGVLTSGDLVKSAGGGPPPNQAPTAAFTSSCSGLTCSFTNGSSDPDGSIVGNSWDFGDGTTSTAANPSHTYAAGGTFTVRLTVTDDDGATGTTTRSVTVAAANQAPTAAFTQSCSGLTCTFTNSSSDPDGSITAHSWTFGDGGTSTAANPSHTYAAGGTYTVRLTVTDDDGATGTTTRSVTVTAPNQPPTAAFTSSCSGLTCSFSNGSSDPDGTITAYNWTFGDGGTSTAASPSHTYAAGGTYTVTLTVTDNRGATNTTSRSVTASQPNRAPTVDAGPNQTLLLGLLYTLSASFTDPDNDGPWSYTIDWGDGKSSSGTRSAQGTFTATHTYLLPLATRTIRVTVTDSHGASGSDTKTVTIIL